MMIMMITMIMIVFSFHNAAVTADIDLVENVKLFFCLIHVEFMGSQAMPSH